MEMCENNVDGLQIGAENRNGSHFFIKTIRIKGKAKPHPKYNEDNYENDIAVVKLDQEINFNDFSGTVAPVCLARYG